MFNPRLAGFILIAAVIAVQLLIVLITVSACVYAGFLGFDVSGCGDTKISEILAAALAAALAIYGISDSTK